MPRLYDAEVMHARLRPKRHDFTHAAFAVAVDANVLIYERVREEKALGRSAFSSIATGYERAMSAIIDANLTTLIAAVLLFGFGSGPIRGFATTLSLGLLTSMFSSTIFTRMLLAVWVRWRRPTELLI